MDNFCIGDPISDKNGVRSCPAMKETEDDRYILKVVSIPASQTKLEALLLAGAYPDADAAKEYFLEQAQSVIEELEVLNSFTEQDGFVPVRQWQLEPMGEEKIGYNVYILTDYNRTLKRQFFKDPLTHLNAVNLGIDICTALATCRNAGYLYADLKPTNILVTADKRFKIGDLGFIKQDRLAYTSLPERYRSAYTAPEVADAFSAMSGNMDVYALGLILYQAYNNGALPFEGDVAPAQAFEAPMYADEEMAGIILKACDPDPANRWQDPAEMGQELISYMQRVGANDTPIAPPAPVVEPEIVIEDEPEETIPAQDTEGSAENEQQFADETEIPDEDIDEEPIKDSDNEEGSQDSFTPPQRISYEEYRKTRGDVDPNQEIDLSFLLELPDPLDQKDEPNAFEAEITENFEAEALLKTIQNADNDATEDEQANEEAIAAPVDSCANQSTMIFNSQNSEKPVAESDTTTPAQQTDTKPAAVPKKQKRGWIGALITVFILLALAAGAYCGYNFYYIKNIESITLDGKLDTLTVAIESDADPSLLTVYCVGNGTRVPAELLNGKATFTNLNPEQRYLIEVEISGLHSLKGKTSATYYAPSQVSLEGLLIQVGDTDGSAKLTFTTKKPYSGQWVIEYSSEGEEKQTVTADSTNITLNDLTIGKEYSITIFPVTGNNWITNNTGTFVAQPVIRAQDVTISEYKNGSLSLTWTCDQEVPSWTVRCYNNTDYNKTVTVSDCTAAFDGLDPAQNYTVEIYADNQTQFQLLHIDDTTLPVEDFAAQITKENFIELNWTCAKTIPEGGWILEYSMSESKELFKVEGITVNNYTFKDVIAGASYEFTLKAANDALVIAPKAEIAVPYAEKYFNNYGDVPFGADNIRLKMCIQPADGVWNNPTFTTTFKSGELAGFTTEALAYYNETIDTEIYILYVIRDENGQLILFKGQTVMWKELFTAYHGTLTVPELPETVGKYTLDIYYNGGHVTTQAFEIVE